MLKCVCESGHVCVRCARVRLPPVVTYPNTNRFAVACRYIPVIVWLTKSCASEYLLQVCVRGCVRVWAVSQSMSG
jgi:hypothetical protein